MPQDTRNGLDSGRAGGRRNIRIGDRRTSVKLEPEMWDALAEICRLTDKDLNQICTEVYQANHADGDEAGNGNNFTSELRVFILDYYRTAAHRAGLVTSSYVSH